METETPQHHEPIAIIMWLVVLLLHGIGKTIGMIQPINPAIISWLQVVSFVLASIVSIITIFNWILKQIKKRYDR